VALEALFEFLFKYRPVVFEKGRLALAAGPATYLVIAIALAIALPALIAYARMRMRGGPRQCSRSAEARATAARR